jgi:glycosyltransferase involved in cell wall biosynthesis
VSRLLDGIKVIDLSQFMIGFSEEEQSYALSMAVEILNPSRIFNFNSRSFWKCLSKYHNRLSKDRTIACLFFCDDLDGNALKHSYFREHAHIFSTGKIWAIGDSREYFLGVCDELLIPKIRRLPISYPPLRSVAMASAKRSYAATGRVLWCGRFDTQKRLDVLLSVVKISPEKSFDVYGFPLLDSDQTLVEQLRSVSNVHFAGRYENFSELNVDAYDCLLMTTQWEGTPNIVLEAGLRFLPVVAPQVGGVTEVLGDGRGYLIRRFDDVREICAMLAQCGSEREDARIRAQKCYEYVSEHHTEQNLAAALRQMEINQ